MRAHIRQTRSWQIYSPQMAISQIPTLRTHISQVRTGHIYPYPPQWFHRFLLWGLIFGRQGLEISTPIPHSDFTDSYSENSYLGDQVLADLPLSSCNFTDSYSESSYLANQVLGISTPLKWQCHRFLTMRTHIWETRSWTYLPQSPTVILTDSYTDNSDLPDQVLAYLPSRHQTVISQISTLRAHIWHNQVLGDLPSQMAISQLPNLRAYIWQTRSWQIYPLKWQYHKFLLWELIFGR